MNIGFDFNKGAIITTGDKPQNEDENRIIYAILDKLDVDAKMFRIEKNSNDYTTLKYKQYDLIRIKYTNAAKWIKILMINKELKKEYMNNPLFDAQTNKNELMWKSTINDINDYVDVITDAIEGIISMNSKQKTYEPNDDELKIATLLMDNLDIDFSISKTSSECTNIYLGGTPRVIFDIKCTTRSKWIRFRGKDFNKKIDISNLDDKLIDKLKNKIKKELE